MMKLPLSYFCLFLVMMIGASMSGYASQSVRIEGRILDANNEAAASVKVVLKEILMSNPPQIKSILSTQTDENGTYHFVLNPSVLSQNNAFYRISLDIEGQSVGSDPFRLQTEPGPKIINLSIPATLEGLENITFVKEVVIIESTNEAVHITNLVFMENASGAVVNAREIPFRKRIPANAFNFNLLSGDKGGNISDKRGEIAIELSVPAGKHELIFSYDVPVDNGEVNLNHDLSYSVKEVEFTTPDNSLEIDLDDSLLDGGRVLSERKRVGDREFYSKILKLNENRDFVPIVIRGIPVAQNRLFLPALVLFFVLIAGLAWYVLKHQKLQRNSA